MAICGAADPAYSNEDGMIVSSESSDGGSMRGALDFSGCLPSDRIRTIALVMPASIQGKARFDEGKAALEAAGYKVKVMPRLNFKTVAPVADRVADFEQAWMDPEVDLVLCARGGVGAEDLLDKLDWAKLRTRKQRVLGFSNITMLLNAMLKEKAGRPFSGPTLSQLIYARPETLTWLAKALEPAPLRAAGDAHVAREGPRRGEADARREAPRAASRGLQGSAVRRTHLARPQGRADGLGGGHERAHRVP